MYTKIRRFVTEFYREEDGPTTVEYAVMLMLIVAVCLSLIQAIGLEMADCWTNSQTEMTNAINN